MKSRLGHDEAWEIELRASWGGEKPYGEPWPPERPKRGRVVEWLVTGDHAQALVGYRGPMRLTMLAAIALGVAFARWWWCIPIAAAFSLLAVAWEWLITRDRAR